MPGRPGRHGLWLAALAWIGLTGCFTREETSPHLTVRGKVRTGMRRPAPVTGASVGFYVPSAKRWVQIKFSPDSKLPNAVLTDAQGAYALTVQWEVLQDFVDRPVYLMASDASQSSTLLAEIPRNAIVEGGALELDLDPASTAAGLWHCPHGVFATPDYACPKEVTCQYPGGAGCWQDLEARESNAAVVNAIAGAVGQAPESTLPEPSPTDWGSWIRGLLDQPSVLGELNRILQGAGRWPVDPATVEKQVRAQPLPKVQPPTAEDLNDGSCGTPGTICSPGQTCVSSRNCIPSIFGGSCSCSTSSTQGTCQSNLAPTCSPPGGVCGDGKHGCCPGATCVKTVCEGSPSPSCPP